MSRFDDASTRTSSGISAVPPTLRSRCSSITRTTLGCSPAPAERRSFLADTDVVGDVLQHALHVRRINRLAHVVDRALLERFDRVGYLALPRDHDRREANPQLTDIMEQLESALARHSQVRKQNMRIEAANKLQCPHPVLRNLATKPPRPQRFAPLLVRIDVIFRDQNSNFICHWSSKRTGARSALGLAD